jgi:hypothetical protein
LSQRIEPDYTHQILTERIIGACYRVYAELGYGFLESVYENAVALVLRREGILTERQVPISVWFQDQQVGMFRADLWLNGALYWNSRPSGPSKRPMKHSYSMFCGHANRDRTTLQTSALDLS